MAVHDITRRSLLSKYINLSRDIWLFWELKYQEKCFSKYFLVRFRESVDWIAKVSSRCLHYLLATMLED